MIGLNLRCLPSLSHKPELDHSALDQLYEIEDDLQLALDGLRRFRAADGIQTVMLPTDLLFHAVDVLSPAERMAVAAGRTAAFGRIALSTMYDVTGVADRTHVRAHPGKLAQALTAFERAGVELLAWIHSHPGSGPAATAPSPIDRRQYADWVHHYTDRLVAIIVVQDGFIRLWGDAIERQIIRIKLVGKGVHPVAGRSHVYRLDR